jgi:ceramide glucosyltransferase
MTVWINSIAIVALVVACIGVLSSSIFLLVSLLGTAKFHSESEEQRQFAEKNSQLPAVSVLKPVHGAEPRLKQNVESFFRQDYPEYEILFAADEENDAALPIIREVASRYPNVKCSILVTGLPELPNPPAYSFFRMSQVAANDILVTSDSDVEVAPNYLREVVAPMLDPAVGMVTCVYRGKNAGGFWSGMDAIGMSVEMTAGVVTANFLEGMKFGLGPTIVTRKDSIAKIGGYWVTGEYFSNDFVTGNFIEKAGYRVVLSRHIIDHVVPPMTFKRMWERQVRWAKGTRWSRPKGHFGTGLIFTMPYGIVGLLAGVASGHLTLGVGLLAAAIVNRMLESRVIGWGVVHDPRARRELWLYPVRDLLGFAVWCASYLSKSAVWRDHRYQLIRGGRIVLRQEGEKS